MQGTANCGTLGSLPCASTRMRVMWYESSRDHQLDRGQPETTARPMRYVVLRIPEGRLLKHVLIPAFVSISLLAGCASDPGPAGGACQPAFRVRSDFRGGVDADQGWAGALNENVTSPADRPFRVRLELERPPDSAFRAPFRLQYPRNGSDWTAVDAHDFPHPVRELELDAAKLEVGATPEGWSVAHGDAGGMTVALVGQERVLRARATQESLTGLYAAPWAATELAAEFRLPAGNRTGLGFVFGYVDAGNHWRVFLDPGAGTIRVSRFVNGTEAVSTEKSATITLGQWHDIEIQTEDEKVEVTYEDEAVEFAVDLGTVPVAFYTADTVHYNIRFSGGTWGADTVLDPGVAPTTAGPKAVLGANDTVHVASYGVDGTVWHRRLRRDGTLTRRQQLASGLGITRAEYGAVLPLVFIPRINTVVIIYRQTDGRLWERRVVNHGALTPAVQVTDRIVIQDAVDSQQPAADAVQDGETLRLLFVEETSRSIFSTHDDDGWQLDPPRRQDPRLLDPRQRVHPPGRDESLRLHL